MIRNKYRQRESPIRTIIIEDQYSSKNRSGDCEKVSHIQYDFVSNMPPSLQKICLPLFKIVKGSQAFRLI
jgi:hypothetical protein